MGGPFPHASRTPMIRALAIRRLLAIQRVLAHTLYAIAPQPIVCQRKNVWVGLTGGSYAILYWWAHDTNSRSTHMLAKNI